MEARTAGLVPYFGLRPAPSRLPPWVGLSVIDFFHFSGKFLVEMAREIFPERLGHYAPLQDQVDGSIPANQVRSFIKLVIGHNCDISFPSYFSEWIGAGTGESRPAPTC